MNAMNKLWNKTSFFNVPNIYSQDQKGDEAIAYVKLFCPQNGWRWYITEYDPKTGRAFGLVQGCEVELGYFAIRTVDKENDWEGEDMQSQNDNWKGKYPYPPFERDKSFKPTSLNQIRKSIERGNPA